MEHDVNQDSIDKEAIPDELRDSILSGQCVLFLGAGVSVGANGIPPGRDLAREIASSIGFATDDLSLPRVAQYFEMTAGRHALTRFLVDRIADVKVQPQESHRLVAALPLNVVVTTNYDRLMESQWEKVGVPYDRVIRNEDLSYTQANRVTYVKFHGSIDVPDSLVVTEDDHERYFEQLGTISLYLKALLASRTLLFVGYSLADPDFKRLYVELTAQVRRHMRRAYAVQLEPSAYDHLWWSSGGRNVQLLEDASASFLRKLVASVRQPSSASIHHHRPPPPAPTEPYKFLNYYDAEDRAVFFGRDEESQEVTNLILAHRVSLLFGSSGVGKTSLIRAGVTPRLLGEGYAVSYLRIAPGTVEDLRRLLVLSAGLAERAGNFRSLEDYLLAHFGNSGRIVLFLDQAEEFFTRNTRQVRAQWARFLEACRDMKIVDLRICVTCRDDFIGDVAELMNEQAENDVLSKRFKLWKLGPEQTRQCIIRPARVFDLEYEPSLANQLVEDLDDRGVDPSQMQVLCSTLFQSRNQNPGQSVVTLAQYQAMGGAPGILANYLEQALSEMPSDRRQVARAILKTLVTIDQTKDIRQLGQFADEALIRRTGAERDTILEVVESLTKMRLIRRLAHTGSFELVHDVLAPRISEWITEEEALLKSAQHSIKEGMVNWETYEETLTRAHWSIINESADELVLTDEVLIFLVLQALLLGDHLDYWIARSSSRNLDVFALLTKEMDARGYRTQENVLVAVTSDDCGIHDEVKASLVGWCEQKGAVPAQRWARRIVAGRPRLTLSDSALRAKYEADLIFVPAGNCLIGSNDSATQDAFEGPQHRVYVPGFHVSKYLVTNIQYLDYVRQTGARVPENWVNGAPSPRQGEYPVVYVSWVDAFQYCQWLATFLARPVRLLTEVEWEKAASWSVGDQISLHYGYGNQFDSTKCNTREAGITEPTAVGTYSAAGGDSPFGLADMTGNVWEWTSTRAASPDGQAFLYPYNPSDGREDVSDLSAPRILRGGSCYNTRVNARSSTRFRINPHYRNGDIGFRIGFAGE